MRRMNPVEKALWYIEAHLDQNVTLADIAGSAGVSRHHVLRAFGAATGLSVMRYVRGRRLTAAALRLASGAKDILDVAIDAGYNSHEAFTRAFGEQFGATPAEVRARGDVRDLALVSPIALDATPLPIEPPRIEILDVLLLAGINRRYDGLESSAGVPGQWTLFSAAQAGIEGRLGASTYGVCFNLDDEGGMDYMCGVPVATFAGQSPHFARLRVPRQRYAVFVHNDHIATIRRTWDAVWNGWLPQSGHEVADAPLLEHYEDSLQPQSGRGGVELMVPLS